MIAILNELFPPQNHAMPERSLKMAHKHMICIQHGVNKGTMIS